MHSDLPIRCTKSPAGLRYLACVFVALVAGVAAGCGTLASPFAWERTAPAMGADAERVSWATPLDGAPITMVYIAPRALWADARALAERLDARITPIDAPRTAPSDDASPTWPEGLREALAANPEVIAIGATPTEHLPAEAIDAILTAVRGGTGLILAHYGAGLSLALEAALEERTPDGPANLERAIGAVHMPEWRRGLYFLETATLGEGRVVLLDYPGGRPHTHALLARSESPREMRPDHREAWYGLIVRLVHWASAREPRATMVGVRTIDTALWDERTAPPDLPEEFLQTLREVAAFEPTRAFEVSLGEPAPRGLSLKWQLRSPPRRARLQADTPIPVQEGSDTVLFPVSAVDGDFYLDIWLMHRGRVVDWRTEAVRIASWPVIEEVVFSHTDLKPHDILGIRATIPSTLSPPRPASVLVRAYDGTLNADGSRRMVAEDCVTVAPEHGSIDLELHLVDLIHPHLRVEIYASGQPCEAMGEGILARAAFAVGEFIVHVPHEYNFPLIADLPPPAEYGIIHAGADLAAAGLTTAHLANGPALLDTITQMGLQAMPRLLATWPARGITGGPPDLAATTDRQDAAWFAWQSGSREAVVDVPGVMTPAEALAALSDFEARFESLRAEGVSTLSPEARILRDQVALHLLSDQEALDQMALRLIEVAEAAPGLRLGLALDPDDAAFVRADWARIGPGLQFSAARLDRLLLRRVAAFLPADSHAYAYTPQGAVETEADAAVRWPWEARLRGASGLWHTGDILPGTRVRGAPLMAPTGQPSALFESMGEGIRDLRQGHGFLLDKARPVAPRIRIVDSRASFWLNETDPLYPSNTLPAQAAWLDLFEALGYACGFLEADALTAETLDDVEVVVLPMARALGDQALDALARFVDAGGLVVADVLPGTHDALGGLRERPAAAEALFGVHPGDAEALPDPVSIEVVASLNPDEISASWTLEDLFVNPGIVPGTAMPFGAAEGHYAWLHHANGDGAALVLNHPLLPARGGESDLLEPHAVLREWLEARLGEAGIQPDLVIRGGESLPPGLEFAVHELDEARVVALLGPPSDRRRPVRLVLALGESGEAYDLRTGERFPAPDRVRVTLEHSRAALIGVLPYRVDGIEAMVPPEVMAGRRLEIAARVLARDRLPGRHLLRLEVHTLEGRALHHYTRHLEASSGQLRTYLPLARNEAPGWYRLVVRDLLSGQSTEARFQVIR